MSVADDLAGRIRLLLADKPGVTEQKMFGGRCFMLDGNMLVCAIKGGELLVRVPTYQTADALAQPGAAPMRMGAREMKGFIGVSGSAIDDDASIVRWIAFAEPYVRTLPHK